ncbi:MAG: hypothetical protein GX753_04745 [Erysipelothrix sp.]|nr:hypothetical protein [Erysipelothrix sp.]
MKVKKYTGLIIILIVLVSLLSNLLLNSKSLNFGVGFGRKMSIITTSVEDNDSFKDFKDNLPRYKAELSVYEVEEGLSLIQIESTGDMSLIYNSFLRQVSDIEVLEVGTFGSITNVNQTISNMQLYFTLFFLVFVAIWFYQFGLLGLILSLLGSLMVFLPVFIGNAYNFILNVHTWYVFVCVYILVINYFSWLLDKIYIRESVKVLAQSTFMFSFLFVLMGLVFHYLDPIFKGAVFYVIAISILFVILSGLIQFGLQYFYKEFLDDEVVGKLFFVRSGITTPSFINRFSLTILIVGTTALGFLIANTYRGDNMTQSVDFSRESYLIVDSNHAQGFLEIQASLGKYDLDRHLLEYNVSEEKATWFVFDEFTSKVTLNAASRNIDRKIVGESRLFTMNIDSFNLEDLLLNPYLGLMVLVGAVIIAVLRSFKSAGYYLYLSSVVLGIYYMMNQYLNLPISYAMMVTFWFIAIYAFAVVMMYDDLFSYQGLFSFISRNMILLFIVYFPVLLFVMESFSFVISNTVMSFVAFILAFIFVIWMKRLVSYAKNK